MSTNVVSISSAPEQSIEDAIISMIVNHVKADMEKRIQQAEHLCNVSMPELQQDVKNWSGK